MVKQQKNIIIMVAIIVATVTGTYMLFRPPAPKLLPEQQQPEKKMEQVKPEPIPGEPMFDVAKYPQEPSVVVWVADKGYKKTMPLEQYLEGVVAKEMVTDWPLEALSAQAIVSRTLTLKAMETGTIKKIYGTDVSTAKEKLQAYAPEKINTNVKEAVRRTRGQVLLYAGSLVHAIYSSCNGGVAATKEESFPKEIQQPAPYFQPITDNCMDYAPQEIQKWSVKIPGKEVAAAVGYSGNPGDVKILEKGPSGRILFIGAGDKKVYGSDFRKKIGYDRLKSTLITEMNYDGSNFNITGRGWGNGVGLCQWGAYADAQAGWTAEKIVLHYYPRAEIKKIWE